MDHVFCNVDHISASFADWDRFDLCGFRHRADPASYEVVIDLMGR